MPNIFIREGGKVLGRYSDSISCLCSGLKKIYRVTDIEWSSEQQKWEARFINSRVLLCSALSREICLRVEADLVDRMLEDLSSCWDSLTKQLVCPECKKSVNLFRRNCVVCGFKFQTSSVIPVADVFGCVGKLLD